MLTASDKWKAAARAGTVQPVVLMEIQPTETSAESSRQNDWQDVASSSNINLAHPSGDLVLASVRTPYSAQQGVSRQLNYTFFRDADYEETAARSTAKDTYSEIGQFLQTVKIGSGFRLLELWIGAKALKIDGRDAFNGKLIVRLYVGLAEPGSIITYPGAEYHSPSAQRTAKNIYAKATHVLTLEADFGETYIQGARYESVNGNVFMVWDISDRYLFIKGNQIISLDLMVDRATGAEHVKLFGAAGGTTYPDGQLYEHNHLRGHSYELPADLAFRLITEGYSPSGTVTYQFDMGADPAAELAGEVELSYCLPAGTSLSARVREKADGGAWGAWSAATDGYQLGNKRYVQVELTLGASADGLRSPLVYAVKAAYRRIERFVLADEPIEGYPHILLKAPSYSASGDPLAGKVDRSDTLDVELADPSGMISSGLFGNYNLKNDKVIFSLGFKGLPIGDYLPLKTLWIEDWLPLEGYVSVTCYDRLSRFFSEDVPNVNEQDPSLTEQIHFDGESPAAIKRQLFARAGSRPSQINAASLAALDAEFSWELQYTIEEPTEPEKVCQELNKHLLAFEFNDEAGQWRTPFADFSAAPAATLEESEILIGSEQYSPGLRYVKNGVVVFFGGAGSDESKYSGVVIEPDEESAERYQEIRVDKLLSEFIPAADDPGDASAGIALDVARRRRFMQRDGLRTMAFSTHLQRADLQIGDHIQFYSGRYVRPGAANSNPLLVFITSKHVAPTLSRVNFSGLVLLDAEQSVPGAVEIAPPQNVQAVDNGDGTATVSWDKSLDDNGSNIVRYLVFRRRWSLLNWGAPVAEVTADGSASYSLGDSDHRNTLAYDYGVRAAHKSGRVSRLIEVEKVQITNNLLAPPSWTLIPIPGGWGIKITADTAGATEYVVYKYHGPTENWLSKGRIAAPAWRGKSKSPYHFEAQREWGESDYGRFRLSTVNSWGEGSPSTEQAAHELPVQRTLLAAADIAPTLPAESGTYPALTRVQQADGAFSYYAELKVVLPAGYEDMIRLVRVQRREYSGSAWLDWIDLPSKEITTNPAPPELIWRNTQAELKPGKQYQWRAGTVSLDGTESTWSDPLGITVTADTTTPDKPSILTVTVITTGILINLSAITQGGNAVKGKHYYKVEGQKSGGNWEILSQNHEPTWFLHTRPDANQDETWRFRVTAYNNLDVASTVSDVTNYYGFGKLSGNSFTSVVNDTLAQVSVNEGNILLKVDKAGVINAINISTEGIKITASKLSISGSTEFASGYDPSSKLPALAGQYNSAASGARVRIFPDAYTGILVTDGTNDVFKVLVGGTDVGDVIIGSAGGQNVTWDKSAGQLIINGLLAASGGIQTSAGNDRIALGGYGGLSDYLTTYKNGNVAVTLKGHNMYFSSGTDPNKAAISLSGSAGGSISLSDIPGTTDTIELHGYSGVVEAYEFRAGTNGYKVSGTKVVGAQGAHIVDADGTLADITSKFNTLLTRLEAGTGHGLLVSS